MSDPTDVPSDPRSLSADDKILWGVVANAGRLATVRHPRWHYVKEATSLGATSSIALCRRFDFDPDEIVGKGPEYDACTECGDEDLADLDQRTGLCRGCS